MNAQKHQNQDFVMHRSDLADLIIAKSKNTKQNLNNSSFFFVAAKPAYKIAAFMILISAFFFGFKNASTNFEEQQISEQKSVIEEIYYPNSQIL